MTTATDAGTQLRRRRDAANRLPPLDDGGARDPLDRQRHNTFRVAHVYDGSRRALVRSNDLTELRRVLAGLGITGRWVAPDHAVVVAKAAGPDIVAALEHFGWRVVAHDGEPTR